MVEVGDHPTSRCSPTRGRAGRWIRRQLHRHGSGRRRAASTPSCARAAASASKSAPRRSSTRVRGRAGLPQGGLPPFPQAVPKYPGDRPENCTYFQKGTCKACEKFCPTNAIDFEQEGRVITCRGWQHHPGHRLRPLRRAADPQYGYGRLANVFTSLEFERLTNAAGPTNGDRPARRRHRAGSGRHHPLRRQPRPELQQLLLGHLLHAELKFAHLVKERTGATVYNFYIDMRTAAKDYDEFYQRLLEEGVALRPRARGGGDRRRPVARRRRAS
jgi:ferredoxin